MAARLCLCENSLELPNPHLFQRSRFSSLAAVAFYLVAVLLFPPFLSELRAQSISISAPASTVTVPEAADFAATILNNPWDFSERRDIGWEENYSGPTVGVSNGVWSAVSSVSGPYVFPLFG